MNQQDYLKSLKTELELRKVPNIGEILADYDQHFADALRSGKTESEIVEKLGQPELIAKAYETESMISQAQKSNQGMNFNLLLSSIGRLIIIAPFNFIFILGPTLATFGILFAGWSVTGALGIVALAALGVLPGLTIAAGTWGALAALFGSLGFIGLTGMFGLIMYVLTRGIAKLFLSYLQWNLKFILAK
jgi:uncharacterized membrane protein